MLQQKQITNNNFFLQQDKDKSILSISAQIINNIFFYRRTRTKLLSDRWKHQSTEEMLCSNYIQPMDITESNIYFSMVGESSYWKHSRQNLFTTNVSRNSLRIHIPHHKHLEMKKKHPLQVPGLLVLHFFDVQS